ncbi:phosphotyrosine protein phosphatase [Candidatus Marinamargulisbacteria bacterium SCGC AAA071-K20]|nr:phosphotyrosine protein phosphatase [Candidatus Marinamargulisbacteria bacterium SCGC AAA071-K20]
MGNICRSPAAEGILKKLLKENNLEMDVDSAGMISYHSGAKADARMREHGQKRGVELTSISRPFDAHVDFDYFDMIIAMDQDNLNDLDAVIRTEKDREKIHLMTDFLQKLEATSIPDPYYGGDVGFDNVYNLLEDACAGLLDHLTIIK